MDQFLLIQNFIRLNSEKIKGLIQYNFGNLTFQKLSSISRESELTNFKRKSQFPNRKFRVKNIKINKLSKAFNFNQGSMSNTIRNMSLVRIFAPISSVIFHFDNVYNLFIKLLIFSSG